MQNGREPRPESIWSRIFALNTSFGSCAMPAKPNLPYKYCDDSALSAYFQRDTARLRTLQWLIAKSGKEHQLVSLSITIPHIQAALKLSGSAHRSQLAKRISALYEKQDLRF